METIKVKDVGNSLKFRESAIAHKYLDGLKGYSIGCSAHNSFGLDTINVDFTDEFTVFKQAEVDLCGEYAKVDVVADASKLPFKAGQYDFVVTSHVLEHTYDLISVLKELKRTIKKGGYIFSILPLPEVCPNDRVVEYNEFISRIGDTKVGDMGHCSMCTMDTFIRLGEYHNLTLVEALPIDDKVSNGYNVIFKKK